MPGNETKPPTLDVEVDISREGARRVEAARPLKGPPVHPLSAAVLLAVDNLWNPTDWAVATWLVTIPASFISRYDIVPALACRRPGGC
ncbi:MAG: hypothetical protein KDM81_11110 [Verrucomicrobiae bacterium]|nr:hypothetical protein [Verrucomicrobiae bacterium]